MLELSCFGSFSNVVVLPITIANLCNSYGFNSTRNGMFYSLIKLLILSTMIEPYYEFIFGFLVITKSPSLSANMHL